MFEDAKVTVGLKDFDDLRDSEKLYQKCYLDLKREVESLVDFNMEKYYEEADKIDDDDTINTDKEIDVALKKASKAITAVIDGKKLRRLIRYCCKASKIDVGYGQNMKVEIRGEDNE